MDTSSKIESILFYKGEPVSTKKLAEILNVTEKEIEDASNELEKNLQGRGVVLMKKENELMLGTSPDNAGIIEKIVKDELSKDLGKAGLETLSIILYLGPVKRSEVDYIRGVNSQFIIRNLLIRGLVEKVNDPKDQRAFLYKPTFELLSHLGISKIEDLPEYEKTKEEIASFKKIEQAKEESKEDAESLET
jgi:segregation and condensation protein B